MTGTALTSVLKALEYLNDKGLVTVETPVIEDGRLYVWQEIREKFKLDAAYFHGIVPVVYFKEFQSVNDDELWHLHRSLWNHNRAPLLIAILPQEVRVYNCFTPPQRPSGQLTPENPILFQQEVRQVTDVLVHPHGLSQYGRREIVSGRFVREQQGRFNRKYRVDNRLLENLQELRNRLIDDGLSESVANSLLGRSIFVRYLEDRGVIDEDYFKRFAGGASFHALLEESCNETYQLFDELAYRFNGDLFPVETIERDQVKSHHLQCLGRFLGGEEVSSGQMYFWAYDFKYIPIELISAIYEMFLDEVRNRTSAYYTPPEIVEFVLNDVLPFKTKTHDIRILDPACGSGVFLVEAYRRLVSLHRHARGDQNLNFEELRDLLTRSIHGVDLSEDAIQVAAFSCYLALLDFLEPKSIWEKVRLPKLKGTNLFVNDFFDVDAPFNEHLYDTIVGNPPWRSSLTRQADSYIQENRHTIGDRQIAQAFMWRVPKLLSDEGRACLLAPSKSVLFNQSGPNRNFRRKFFAENRVTKVVDFSAFRQSLFREAVAPMAAMYFQKHLDTDNRRNDLTYLSLHPSPMSEVLAGVAVFGDEMRRLSHRQIANHPYIWKMALWGTPRDLALVDDLRERFPSLDEVGQRRGWVISRGATVGAEGKKKHVPQLAQMRYVPTTAIKPFRITSKREARIEHEMFHRPRDLDLFLGPHILIRGGVTAGGFLASSFLADDAVFKNGVIGIAGPSEDRNHLKIACAYINSTLARYYQFLTSSTWGVERDVVELMEYKNFPCALPVKDRSLRGEIVKLVDHIQQADEDWNWRPDLDRLVYESYGITSSEEQTIRDFVETTMSRHYHGLKASAFKPPRVGELSSYAIAFADVFAETTGRNKTLQPFVYNGTPPYRAVSFLLTSRDERVQHPGIKSEPELDQLLVKLEQIVTEQYVQSFYFRRNIKIYESDAIHIVKPAERRFWTRTAAYNDADETIGQLLQTLSLDGA